MTKPFHLTLLASIALCAWGCSSPSSDPAKSGEDQPATSANAEFKVALLTPGKVSDAGWSAMAYDGLKNIELEMGATVSNEEATGTKIKDSMRSYAQEGYGLVFGHGFEYNAPAIEVAKDFPKTVFVSSSGGQTATNVGAFRFYLEQGCYLAGMVAGSMTKTGSIARVALGGIPSIDSTLKAFEAGAKEVRPDVKIIKVELQDDTNLAAARRATLSAIDNGADFVIHQANAAAQVVFDACREKKVYAFGTNLDQNNNASGAVIASAVIVAKPAFLDLARRVQSGTYKGGIELWGMDKGAIEFVFNPDLEQQVPEQVKELVRAKASAIKDGSFIVPKDEF